MALFVVLLLIPVVETILKKINVLGKELKIILKTGQLH
jgi:hypothetical protein